MSGLDQQTTNENSTELDHSEAERILASLRLLREEIVTAWQERAVILSRKERTELHDEIKETCRFLEYLTRED